MMKNRFNMSFFCNKKWVRYALIFLMLLWIPTLLMLLFGGQTERKTYKIEDSGKEVVIDKDGKTQSLDVEEFIPCAVVAQIDINSEEEMLKTFTVIMRTYINFRLHYR